MTADLGVLYIVSSGRSGSTALELLAATHPLVATAGELQTLGHDLRSTTRRCGCGATMADCPVWQHVAATGVVQRAPVPLALLRASPGAGRVLRWGWLPEVLLARRGPKAHRWAEGSAEGTWAVLGALAEAEAVLEGAPSPAWFVDASKDVYRLHLLASGATRPLRAVHLVRDPRGFVHAAAGPTARRTLRLAARWSVQQVLAARALRQLDAHHRCTMRYEDLAAAPGAALASLGALLRVDASAFSVDRLRTERPHAVAGNAMRRRDEPLTLDERWRTTSPRWQRLLVWGLTAPVARRYGYRWRQR